MDIVFDSSNNLDTYVFLSNGIWYRQLLLHTTVLQLLSKLRHSVHQMVCYPDGYTSLYFLHRCGYWLMNYWFLKYIFIVNHLYIKLSLIFYLSG